MGFCSICYKEKTEGLTSLSCGHIFHCTCIEENIKKNKYRCPECFNIIEDFRLNVFSKFLRHTICLLCEMNKKCLQYSFVPFAKVPESDSVGETRKLHSELQKLKKEIADIKEQHQKVKRERMKIAKDCISETQAMEREAKRMNETLKYNHQLLHSAQREYNKKQLTMPVLLRKIHQLKRENRKLKEQLDDVNQSIINLLSEQY